MSRLSFGEREAFDPLFRALYPRALRLAQVKLKEDQAADAAQLIMMKVFARASEFEAGKPVLPWFYAVAANEVHTLRRRAIAHRSRELDESAGHEVSTEETPERTFLEHELRRCVQRAISCLDVESAEAIGVMLNDGPRPPIAGSAFRKRVSRAYGRLRLLLGGLDGK